MFDRSTLGLIRFSFSSSVAFNIVNEKIIVNLIATRTKMYEKYSASNMVFLMKRLLNIKMLDRSSMAEHLNNFIIVMNQLCSVGIKFDDEVRTLLLLFSLPDTWDGLVTALRNT